MNNRASNPLILPISSYYPDYMGMSINYTGEPSKPNSIANHTIDPDTGFVENNGFSETFDAERKKLFLESLRTNGLNLSLTCKQNNLSNHTVYKHLNIDTAFKRAYHEMLEEYTDSLEAFSRVRAFDPKATLERIFQLRALRPEKYAREQMGQAPANITVQVQGDLVMNQRDREKMLTKKLEQEEEQARLEMQKNAVIVDAERADAL